MALFAEGDSIGFRLSCERARFTAVLNPLANGAAMKANFCVTFAIRAWRGDGGTSGDGGTELE